jgi:eukaryotic-like serine/threonine-protein kinase
MASSEFSYIPDGRRNVRRMSEPVESSSQDADSLDHPGSDISTGSFESGAGEWWPTDSPRKWRHLEDLVRIGRGFFSEVYRAWDGMLEQKVALKLYRQAQDGAHEWSRFGLREARFLARIRHPNVVTVYGVDHCEDRLGVWMEYIRGRTLEALLRELGTLAAREAVLIGLDVCSAVAAAHQSGLLHRDIKARNVMRENGGRIVLMDFGLGQDLLPGSTDRAPRVCGTPLYMAPEVLRGESASVQSDIYSIGILLYRLVTGSFPVEANSMHEVSLMYERGEATLLRDRRPDLPEPFVRVVERSLAAEPGERFVTAGQMAQALSATFVGYAWLANGGS